jgi:SAM-dependent methyltransferase
MSDAKQLISDRMRDHYEAYWSGGDPWNFARSAFDAERYAKQMALVGDRKYRRVLDLGCGSGEFTRLLCDIADAVVAVDIAPTAIAAAKKRCEGRSNVEFRVADMMKDDARAGGPWDLIVMSESIYCLGWLYPLFDVGWFVSELLRAMRPGARFLLVNTIGTQSDYLLLPWLIRTYRDLFLNVGYVVESECGLRGRKNGVEFEVVMTLFRQPSCEETVRDAGVGAVK